jgi:isopentenyl diphosphate isomerase/L-lactate dehydrogenase-like FMN-dependent dehydrogenase
MSQSVSTHRNARRRFLEFLAASPLALCADWTAGAQTPGVDDVLEVLDLEAAARQALPPAHFGYLATGTDSEATLGANRAAFGRYQLRVRRLVDVAAIEMAVTIFGETYDSPLVLAPVGSQRAFHPDGELAAARVARARRALMILSSVASIPIEPVNEARGAPVWYQLYPTNDFEVGRAVAQRAARAGCTTLVLTVDNLGNNRLTQQRLMREDSRPCSSCHPTPGPRYFVNRPMYSGLDLSRATQIEPFDWTWDYLKRLRDATPMKLVLKGIVTREDAELAVTHGVDGLIVSNHGGRAEDSGRGAIECLPEVVAGVAGRVPVLVDGGFRRGTDLFKALALGATGVGIGRPYVWGLAAFGQAGVDKTLDLLTRELRLTMRQAGTRRLADIGAQFVIDRGRY